MHFAVAVDFTASNGDPRDPRSLHFIDYSGRPNQYEVALRSVGEVIKSYDTQGLFPAYGFGAKFPTGQVSHNFPLNNNMSYPYCRGIEEIISCYKNTLNAVTLHGPTNFAPVINSTASTAQRFQDGKHYFVLLIITDGVISDMSETLDAIVNASTLPLSIIIIGVGNADFSSMDFLDGDGNQIISRGKRAQRDIVQFVPLNRFVHNDWQQNQIELGRAVLAEIPTQFMQFMQSRGFKPSASFQSAGTIFPEPSGDQPTAPAYGTTSPPSAPPSSGYPPTTGPPNTGYPPSGPPNTGYPPSAPPSTAYPSAGPQNPSYPAQEPGKYPSYPPQGPGGYPNAPPPSSYPPPAGNPSYPSAPNNYPNPTYPAPGTNQYPAQGGYPPAPGLGSYPPTGTSSYPSSGATYPPSGANPYPPVGGSAYPQPGANSYPPPGGSSYPAPGPNTYPAGGHPPPTSYPSAPPNPSYPSYPGSQPGYPPY